jgi:hypothetical protein
MVAVAVGVDLGQKRDPTAIAVVEAQRRSQDGRSEDYYITRFLERLPLGTPYPAIAQRVQAVITNIRRQVATSEPPRFEMPPPSATITLYVDGTGVGQPVVDLLKCAGVYVRPVYFTHGDKRIEQKDRSITLGKAWLVSRLQALLQTARILLPRTIEAQALAQELLDYEIHVDEKANDTYGAFRVGSHDDLVTALGLAVQEPVQQNRITIIEHDIPQTHLPAISPHYWRSGRP